ncbi:MAG: minor capsid protein [Bacteroidales bacterium]|nr:minor capsid protein [Bacteroidales bacterium]
MLYPPSSANASPMAGQPADDSLRQLFLDIAQRLYNGDDPSDDPALLRQTAAQLLEGVEKGFGHALPDLEFGTPDYDTLEELARNVYHFSAAKNYHELHDLSLALRDGDRLRSFDEFMHLADEITGKYTINWLRSEYNQAVAAAQCAARWNEYSSRKDIMPYLQYTAVMDGNTREEHAALNGVVKRIDDPFWDKYYPPNGWGCRCEAVQLPGSHYRETSDTEIQYPAVPKMFLANFGKSRMVFPQGHPYYKRLPKEQEHLLLEKSRAEVRRILDNAEQYKALKANSDYKDVDFEWKNGGVKATHIGHNGTHPNDKQRFFGNLSNSDLEIECQNILFRKGNSAILCDEGIERTRGIRDTALDLELNGKRVDIASITIHQDDYGNRFLGKHDQIKKFNQLPYITNDADTICLHFHDPEMYSAEKVSNGYQHYKNFEYTDSKTGEKKHLTTRIKHVVCTINKGDGIVETFDFD